ncbi:hypothetical protein HMPREF1621_02908 [Escherichia coli A25922R]|uniref:Uncharacterized protein n=3 Tax=Enterobacteriaceae TaxID=543 RepID=A0A1S5R8A0_SHIFL|nr:hypothetical protein [Shigella flexneri]EFI88699.1 hypothetical protein HMPREF9551_02302 [Escherichia coli MS 196-1]EFJ55687.1 hypothetical protein HMPREF9549_02933 [Escherichia coli MS 185-1]EFJ66148.1 hypothetical protein HMPREF9547_02658 [Escherichia coli MS 175-1]EFJ74338.1 hypothetical protein HMPREF9552_01955 [Escherichia coli MS 198-1]EFK45908.1 hypothetical protein HMPREF9346_02485 [Escherichia coli MS 119-7]EFK66330.1 hypothetical protein HMPREF9347_04818 [Escherichia coli MS 124-
MINSPLRPGGIQPPPVKRRNKRWRSFYRRQRNENDLTHKKAEKKPLLR